jgi:hypothetical protein
MYVCIMRQCFSVDTSYGSRLRLTNPAWGWDVTKTKPHKVPKDMYQSKKMMSALGLKYGKIDVCLDNCMFFWKEHANEKKCLKCDQSRFNEGVTQDDEKVMTEVTHKQLCYFPIIPRLKRLFISKRTVRLMRCH